MVVLSRNEFLDELIACQMPHIDCQWVSDSTDYDWAVVYLKEGKIYCRANKTKFGVSEQRTYHISSRNRVDKLPRIESEPVLQKALFEPDLLFRELLNEFLELEEA